jgi:hypothetical protein
VPGVAGGIVACPLLAMGGEPRDQLIQLGGGHPGQLGERRRMGLLFVRGMVGAARSVPGGGIEGVVPVSVEGVAADRQGAHLLVADLDPVWVAARIKLGVHGQPGAGGGRGAAQRGGHCARRGQWHPQTVARALTRETASQA